MDVPSFMGKSVHISGTFGRFGGNSEEFPRKPINIAFSEATKLKYSSWARLYSVKIDQNE